MPTYDYVCQKCGHRMEVVHGLHGHGPSTCPVCGGDMRKAFAPPAVHFKGTGWARKERSRRGSSGGGSGPRTESAGGDSTTSDTPKKDEA